MFLLARGKPLAPTRDVSPILPTITVLIVAHNEESRIRQKIENALSLAYPKDKVRIVVATDGCSDGTATASREYQSRGVSVLEIEQHLGKNHAINEAMRAIESELVVLTDADSIIDHHALQSICGHFADSEVGAVCGNLIFGDQHEVHSQSTEGLYVRYDRWIRVQESRFRSTLGAMGALYAIRRSVFRDLAPEMSDDLAIPLRAQLQGYHTTYDVNAKVYSGSDIGITDAFGRRMRTIMRELTTLRRCVQARDLVSGLLGFQVLSRKLLRWAAPVFLIMIGLCTLVVLASPVGATMLVVQLLFYGIAGLGFALERRGQSPSATRIPLFFCVMNLAALCATVEFLRGKTKSTWRVVR